MGNLYLWWVIIWQLFTGKYILSHRLLLYWNCWNLNVAQDFKALKDISQRWWQINYCLGGFQTLWNSFLITFWVSINPVLELLRAAMLVTADKWPYWCFWQKNIAKFFVSFLVFFFVDSLFLISQQTPPVEWRGSFNRETPLDDLICWSNPNVSYSYMFYALLFVAYFDWLSACTLCTFPCNKNINTIQVFSFL